MTDTTSYRVVRATTQALRAACRQLVTQYHSYITWKDRPSRKLYWLLSINEQPVGVFGLGSAFNRNKYVKEYMETRHISFNQMANNIVYCLIPGLPPNSGTRFLSLCRRDAVCWWKERYGDDLLSFQTFILPPRTGAVYKADNWEYLGMTQGAGFKMVTLYGDDPRKEKAERRVFKSGEVKYLYRTASDVVPKLIFVRRA